LIKVAVIIIIDNFHSLPTIVTAYPQLVVLQRLFCTPDSTLHSKSHGSPYKGKSLTVEEEYVNNTTPLQIIIITITINQSL
jgi:hypothetical protein